MKCLICGRRTFRSRSLLAKIFRGRSDCGGDCWRCVRECEL